MACISKLAGGFAYDCDTGATGLASAMIINKEDIESFSVSLDDGSKIYELTLKSGAKAYKIDTPKRTLVVSESLKTNEGAPNAFTHSATLICASPENPALFRALSAMTNGSFVILTQDVNKSTRAYGAYYGLSSSSIERSSHDNGGWYTITMETPEQFIGEDAMQIGNILYSNLYGAAIY
jgi:hypothetical protein